MSDKMQRVVLARTPEGTPVNEDFALQTQPMPRPSQGEVLCQAKYLSLDPYMRSQIAGRHISGSITPGDPMLGETVSCVLESKAEGFKPGDLVRCFGGWSSHSIHTPKEMFLLGKDFPAPSLALSTLGMPGLTAWAGLHCLARIKSEDTVVIPAATGGVGAVAGQLAKACGCQVIGIAGMTQKCRQATEVLGFDACLNRRDENLGEELDKACPQGIDVYFDLVGGPMLTVASERLAEGGRVLLCGLISEYNSSERIAGPPPGLWIRARAKVFGLVVYDFEDRRQEFLKEVMPLYHDGRLKPHEDIIEGLASAPEAFCRLMRGENNGKVIVALS
ncbi:MAG: NADP-dependent oxidoreductase [Gammaproteobacteria bacterium]|nr:NADP-dependent oxidoreductase [Gammaproteobacteria bacterium]